MAVPMEAMRRIEDAAALDRPVALYERLADLLIRSPRQLSRLRGEWFGHALHPLLTDFPLGAWIGASLLDLFGGRRSRPAATGLVGFGVAMTVPTALTGLAEWKAADTKSRRVGVVHAASNTVATALYFQSFRARLRGRHWRGVGLALLGGGMATVGGYLGGHLSIARKVGTVADGGQGGAPVAQPDAISFLLEQHEDVRRLFEAVATSTGAARKEAFEPLVRLLAVHETAEEMIVYPALRQAGGDSGAIADARLEEEDTAKKVLAELERMDPASSEFEALFGRFRADVEAHAQREEQEVFPRLEESVDDQQLRGMTTALKAAEAVAPTHPHKLAPESAVGNMVVGPFVAVVDRVRDAIEAARR